MRGGISLSGVVRDFSSASIDNLRNNMKNKKDDWNIFDWFNDTYLIEELNIRDNINTLNNYYEEMMDKYNIGEFKLNKILKDVEKVDNKYAKTFTSLDETMIAYVNKVKKLTEIIKPSHIALESGTIKSYLTRVEIDYEIDKIKIAFGVNNINEIMKKIESMAELSSLQLQMIFTLAKLYPEIEVSPNALEIIMNSLSGLYKTTNDAVEIFGGVLGYLGKSTVKLSNAIDDIIKPFITYGPEGPGQFIITSSDDVGEVFIASGFLKNTGTFLKNTGKNLGIVFGVAGVVFGTFDDVYNDGKTIGQGFTHSLVGVGAGIGGGLIAIGIAGGPVGWAAIGVSFVGGFIATTLYNQIYDNNILGLRDGLDALGTVIDTGIDWVGDRVTDIGQGVGDFISFINPFD